MNKRPGMQWVSGLALIGTAVMGCALVYGFTVGSFWTEGAAITSMPWGVISIIDVYTGGALIAGWIAFRERSWPRTLLWALLIFGLGHFATSVYTALAARESAGDWTRFWFGRSR